MRDDVWVRYKREHGPLLRGPLTVGFSVYGDAHHFGPELQFGWVVGDYLRSQILLVKTAWGGKSLYQDFRPPSSGGETGPYYRKMVAEIREALANLKTDFPGYDGGGCELAGFVWYQGWNDGCGPKAAVPEYETNLANLIRDVRKDSQRAPPAGRRRRVDRPVGQAPARGPRCGRPRRRLRHARSSAATCSSFRRTISSARPRTRRIPVTAITSSAMRKRISLSVTPLGKGMVKLLESRRSATGGSGR